MEGEPSFLQGAYRHLIDFVKAGHSGQVTKKRRKTPPTTLPVTGEDIKSFYEEICAESSSSLPSNEADFNETSRGKGKRSKSVNSASRTDPVLISHKHGSNVEVNEVDLTENRHSEVEHGVGRGIDPHGDSGVKTECKRLRGHRGNMAPSAGQPSRRVKERRQAECNTLPGHRGSVAPSAGQPSRRVKERRQAELLRMAQDGDDDGVKRLLQQGVDINQADQWGWTAAMSAAFAGHRKVVQILAAAGADLAAINSHGLSAACLARRNKHTTLADFIVGVTRGEQPRNPQTQEIASTAFYCDVCKREVNDSDADAHSRSMLHIFNVGCPPKEDPFLIPPSNAGFRLMLKTGWNGTTGLGPRGTGQRFPVKTFLKRDRRGLGNAARSEAKVTHFSARDCSAVASVLNPRSGRSPNVQTLSRRAQRLKERRDRQKEIRLRRELS